MSLSLPLRGGVNGTMEFYHSEENNKLRQAVNWVVDIIVVIVFAFFLIYTCGEQISVSGRSMAPLLEPGDVVLMDRLAYDFGHPDRFDVVVFEREDQKMNVKRVIGLPGETGRPGTRFPGGARGKTGEAGSGGVFSVGGQQRQQ